ncbi:DUF3885 domain-containing protein [Streptomyces milbemycinicus]|uniref:DUF3885 domain-containing protein n=1 Tax=Streptomyces milbemycinicus TaxID=476552 RepID=UPI003F4D5E41
MTFHDRITTPWQAEWRIHYPYDGGADVFLTTPEERDRARDRHAHWLSGSPWGL